MGAIDTEEIEFGSYKGRRKLGKSAKDFRRRDARRADEY